MLMHVLSFLKEIKNNRFSVLVCYFVLIVSFLFARPCYAQLRETRDPLELRLDSLLQKMTIREKIEQLYYLTDSNTRLGIPQFKGSDGPHGIGNNAKGFSCFPVTIGMTATWDPELITKVGRAISLEQAARGKDRIAGPTLDMLIDPRTGRAPETIGEDPFLGGRISAAFVLGQNTTSVFGSIKHYNLNTYERNRRTNNYLSDERSLVELWGPHWKRTIQYGGAISIMCAYNWVNGEKCAENSFLIKDLLRDHWGFNYYTMCDWGGFSNTGKALNAELDFCEGNDLYIKQLPPGVKTGLYDSNLVSRAARNVLRTKIISGMLDGVPAVSKEIIDCKEHRALVYETGLKSLVLLKNNESILPLKKEKIKSIAIIGPNAAVLPLDGNSSSKVLPSYRITVLEGIKNILGAEKIRFSKGCNINDNDKSHFNEALTAAKNADYVLFVGGLDSTVEGEGYFLDKEADEKGGGIITRPDRASQTVLLPGMQNELINEISRINPNLVLVVISGGPCSTSLVLKNVKALLYAFYPGQEGGRAIADVLFGNYNPSGKLPVTIPKDDSQIRPISPDFRNMFINGEGYRWFDQRNLTPEFSFGYGISYTTFAYSNIEIDKTKPKVGELINVLFDVKNTGTRSGEEVTQLYLSTGKIFPSVRMPVKQLKGFKKIILKPGETKQVTIQLSPEELYIYNEQSKSYEIPSGKYIVQVGGSSDHLPLETSFTLIPSIRKPDLLVKNIRTMPAFPKPGESVVFMASLINSGTAATKKGDKHVVRFYVDGKEVAHYFSQSVSIPVGGMKQICAEGVNGNNWLPTNGKFLISARIETLPVNDLNSLNNITEGELTIPYGRVIPVEIAKFIQ